jgi:1-deoxy-D-xylulose-5-phosphate reductoisomerase
MMKQKISVLGSTGSIGLQSLEVIDRLGLSVSALSARRSTIVLEHQVRKYRPEILSLFTEEAARDMKVRLGDTDTRIVSGPEGLVEAASVESAGTVITAVVGTVGLEPTLAAIRGGKRIALANKETLVCAGEIVMKEAREHGAEIVPVDSEHSAIFQCMDANRRDREVKNIILTSSGGPFRGKSLDELLFVTREMALKHPNWKMGLK